MQQVLITGGGGFIGSHLCEYLVARGVRVRVYDNFSSANAHHEPLLRNMGVDVRRGHIEDAAPLRDAMTGCDTLFHLAANPDIAKAVTQPAIDFWQGTLLAQYVFDAARVSGVKTVYYTSGSGVYGECPDVAFREDFGPMKPISTYGASKLACEALLCSYCHMFGMKGRAFRFANVVGPRQTHGVGYDFMRRLKADPKRLRVLGDGSQSKSYIHVDDILNAIFTVAAKYDGIYDIFNVATGDYISVKEIAKIAVHVANLRPEDVELEFTGGDRGWKGDVPVVRFNTEKIEGLGWRCRRGSADAIRDSLFAIRSEL